MNHDQIVGATIGGGLTMALNTILLWLMARSNRKSEAKLRESMVDDQLDLDKVLLNKNQALHEAQALRDALEKTKRTLAELLLNKGLWELNGFGTWLESLQQSVSDFIQNPTGYEQALLLKHMALQIVSALEQRGFDQEKISTMMRDVSAQAKQAGFNSAIFPRVKTLCDGTLPRILAELETSLSPAKSGERLAVKAKIAKVALKTQGESMGLLNEPSDSAETVVWDSRNSHPPAPPASENEVVAETLESLNKVFEADEEATNMWRPSEPPAELVSVRPAPPAATATPKAPRRDGGYSFVASERRATGTGVLPPLQAPPQRAAQGGKRS